MLLLEKRVSEYQYRRCFNRQRKIYYILFIWSNGEKHWTNWLIDDLIVTWGTTAVEECIRGATIERHLSWNFNEWLGNRLWLVYAAKNILSQPQMNKSHFFKTETYPTVPEGFPTRYLSKFMCEYLRVYIRSPWTHIPRYASTTASSYIIRTYLIRFF